MRTIRWFIFVLLLMLAACGGQTEAPASDVDVNAVEVNAEVLELPADVDAQTVAAVKERDDVLVLDVREQWEYDAGHIPDITHIPMGEIQNRLNEIPTDKTVIVTCQSGGRSSQITNFLRENGYEDVHNMTGGIVSWQNSGLPVEK